MCVLVMPPERTVFPSNDDFAVLTCSEILSFLPKIDLYLLWFTADVVDYLGRKGCWRTPPVDGEVTPVET